MSDENVSAETEQRTDQAFVTSAQAGLLRDRFREQADGATAENFGHEDTAAALREFLHGMANVMDVEATELDHGGKAALEAERHAGRDER